MAAASFPQRGEVWRVAFDPSIGGEIKKTRPAIIISNNAANRALNRVQVVPVTSNTGRLYASEALVTIDGLTSKALADQLGTISKLRLLERIGLLGKKDIAAVERAVRLQLDLR